MKKVFILIVFVLLAQSVWAAGFNSEQECRAFSDVLIEKFLQTKFQEAFDGAKPYWPLPAVEIDNVANQINIQWPMVAQRFGKQVGAEFIKEERIGHSFLRYYYLHKFEHHAIYWKIDFYKPQKKWMINSLTFRDDLSFLFE